MEVDFLKKKEKIETKGQTQKEEIARIIHELRLTYKLKDLLRKFNFPKSIYMYWQKRFDRTNKDADLEEKILDIRANHKNYGYRRIYDHLRNQGILINKKKVQRLVQKLKLQVKSFGRKSKYSSYKGHIGKLSDNLIKRNFKTPSPHQKITTDTSKIKYYTTDDKANTKIGKLYLNAFLDMYNGEIISYFISKRPTFKAILTLLEEAIKITSDCKERIFHSDQGWGYQVKQYTKILKKYGITQSMSRKGNCLDNAPMENFFGILKQEMYYCQTYKTYEQLKQAIDVYIKYYNEERIKEKLGYLSPVEY